MIDVYQTVQTIVDVHTTHSNHLHVQLVDAQGNLLADQTFPASKKLDSLINGLLMDELPDELPVDVFISALVIFHNSNGEITEIRRLEFQPRPTDNAE